MSPRAIVEKAVAMELGLIALTDHNSAMNCPAFGKICEDKGIRALFGMEITSMEEVHLLALFDSADAAVDFSGFIYERLPSIMNDPERFGDQVYVDEEENILGEVEKYLGNAVDMTIDEIEAQTHSRGGVFIPSHIDRDLYSMISQLGFLPDGRYDAVEISRHFLKRNMNTSEVNPQGYPVITSSDSHYLDGIGSAGVWIDTDDFSSAGIAAALGDGRVTPFF
jgi:hypothetical protein